MPGSLRLRVSRSGSNVQEDLELTVPRRAGIREVMGALGTSGPEVPLLQGQSIGPLSAHEMLGAGPTLVCVSGPNSGEMAALGTGRLVSVGRDQRDRELSISVRDDPSVSKLHFEAQLSREGCLARDAGSRNGTTLDGAPVAVEQSSYLHDGAMLEAGRSFFRVVDLAPPRDLPLDENHQLLFNRPPRVNRPYQAPSYELEPPPDPPRRTRIPWPAMVLPVVFGGMMAVFGGSPYFALFALMSPIMIVWNFVTDRRDQREGFGARLRDFGTQLAEVRTSLHQARRVELRERRRSAPDMGEILARLAGRREDLWERRLRDPDFLAVRVGTADQPSLIETSMADGGAEDLRAEADDILDSRVTVPAAPVTISLRDNAPVGLAGPPDRTHALARSIAIQAAALQSPSEVQMAAVISPSEREGWEFLKWLPHAWPENSPLDVAPVALGPDRIQELLESVLSMLHARSEEATSTLGGQAAAPERLVLFVDADARIERTTMAQLLGAADLGLSIVWLGRDARELPGECRAVVVLDRDVARLDLTIPETGEALFDVSMDGLSPATADRMARMLSPLKEVGAVNARSEIPRRVDLLAAVGLTDPSGRAILDRWESHDERLGAVVGAASAGPLSVDMRSDGPHGLVAGTTGAGKSELLQALVASFAVAYPPDYLTFLLVDYKGGAAFKDCAELPHTVGLVTDLDEHLTQRALTSLEAELRDREETLGEYGAKDLLDLRRRQPDAAPPSLLIVIDEFATLAREVPEFVDGVVDVAQRGRSLGVHMILATQRPGGVVTDNIRANTNLRIALRVSDPSESEDVISSREAARVARSLPGRAFLRTGHSELTEFQSAYVGGQTVESAGSSASRIEVRPFRLIPEESSEEGSRSETAEEVTDLVCIAQAIEEAFQASGKPPPRPPWLPELPPLLAMSALPHGEDTDGRATVGLVDIPERQEQVPFTVDLERDGHLIAYGGGGTGKSSLLLSLAAALCEAATPDQLNIYALDYASRALSGLIELPHVGAVVAGEDEERARRLFRMLEEEASSRKRLFAENSVSGIEAYRETTGKAMPRLVLMIDSFPGFMAAWERSIGISPVDTIPQLVSDGRALGIHVVVTADRPNGVPGGLASVISSKLVFQLAESDGFTMLGLDRSATQGARLGPGRAFTSASHEVQLALPDEVIDAASEGEGMTMLGERMRSLHGEVEAPTVGVLPSEVAAAELPEAGEPATAAIGVADSTLGPAVAGFAEGHFVVSGPYRSGRSNLLAVIAESLAGQNGSSELVLVAPKSSPLEGMPIWSSVSKGEERCGERFSELASLLEQRELSETSQPPVFVFIDDAGELAEAGFGGVMEAVIRRGRYHGITVVAAFESNSLRSFSPWVRELRKDGRGFLLQPDLDVDGDLLNAQLPRALSSPLVAGRGFLVENGLVELVQAARL